MLVNTYSVDVEEGIASGVNIDVDVDEGKTSVEVELGKATDAIAVLVERLVVIDVTKVAVAMVKTRLESVGASSLSPLVNWRVYTPGRN